MPALASDSLLALALMYGSRSFSVFGGRFLLPTSTIGTSAISPMYSKSFSGSKPRLRYSAGAVDMPIWWISTVWPSFFDWATFFAPIVPPAPPRFSITMVAPRCLDMTCASSRATLSVGPPAANGTTAETGRLPG